MVSPYSPSASYENPPKEPELPATVLFCPKCKQQKGVPDAGALPPSWCPDCAKQFMFIERQLRRKLKVQIQNPVTSIIAAVLGAWLFHHFDTPFLHYRTLQGLVLAFGPLTLLGLAQFVVRRIRLPYRVALIDLEVPETAEKPKDEGETWALFEESREHDSRSSRRRTYTGPL